MIIKKTWKATIKQGKTENEEGMNNNKREVLKRRNKAREIRENKEEINDSNKKDLERRNKARQIDL